MNDPKPVCLIADDEPLIARFLMHIANACGYETQVASDGPSFKARYDETAISVVILDLVIPGCDGIELMEFLADRCSQCPIIVLSGSDRRVVEAAMIIGRNLGLHMVGGFTKPVPIWDMKAALNELAITLRSDQK